MLRLMVMRALVALLVAVAISGCADERTGAVSEKPFEPATVSVGETIDFSMHTHCGVEGTYINGRAWKAVEPLYSSPDKHSPPDGWGNPFQNGMLTLESPQRAVFAALGQQVVLVPSTTDETLPPCA